MHDSGLHKSSFFTHSGPFIHSFIHDQQFILLFFNLRACIRVAELRIAMMQNSLHRTCNIHTRPHSITIMRAYMGHQYTSRHVN